MWLAMLGCTADLAEVVDRGRHLRGEVVPRRDGLAVVPIHVDGDDAMQVTTTAPLGYDVVTYRLVDPSGEVVLDSRAYADRVHNKTLAVFSKEISTLSWPISADDGPLVDGRWRVELGVLDADLQFVREPATVDVLLVRRDTPGARGLDVVVHWTDRLDEDPDHVAAVDRALGIWRDIYSAFGIELRATTSTTDLTKLVAPADERLIDVSAQTGWSTVDVMLTDFVGFNDSVVLGASGDVPGPLVPTPRSAVQINLSAVAGLDGFLDGEDTRMLAEVMAHETGHFLGLFHPVEAETDYQSWDVLDDTWQCGNEETCRVLLGDNLMYPVVFCDEERCSSQQQLTLDQQGVLHRAVAVR